LIEPMPVISAPLLPGMPFGLSRKLTLGADLISRSRTIANCCAKFSSWPLGLPPWPNRSLPRLGHFFAGETTHIDAGKKNRSG